MYLHVFSWPQNKRLVVPGIYNDPDRAYLLTDQKSELKTFREDDGIVINIPSSPPDLNNSVVVLDLVGKPDVNDPPIIIDEQNIFIDTINVSINTERENIEIHYTEDGSVKDINSPRDTPASRAYWLAFSTASPTACRLRPCIIVLGSSTIKSIPLIRE